MAAHRTWTDEQIATARKMWTKGHLSSLIAKELEKTKSGVISLAHRHKFPQRRAAGNGTIKQPKRRPEPVHAAGIISRAESRVLACFIEQPQPVCPDSRHVSIMALESYHCRWPIGTPGLPGFSFCGADISAKRYCEFHHRMAYLPAPTRKQREIW